MTEQSILNFTNGMGTDLWAGVVLVAALAMLVAALPWIRKCLLKGMTRLLDGLRELAREEELYMASLRADWVEHRESDECAGDDCSTCSEWEELVEQSRDDLADLRQDIAAKAIELADLRQLNR